MQPDSPRCQAGLPPAALRTFSTLFRFVALQGAHGSAVAGEVNGQGGVRRPSALQSGVAGGFQSPPPAVQGARHASASSPPAEIAPWRSEEHTSELQSLMRISYTVFCLNKN